MKRGAMKMGSCPKQYFAVIVLCILTISSTVLMSGFASPWSSSTLTPSKGLFMGSMRLEWVVDAIKNDTSPLSTPALADMNGDGKMEIVLVSADGNVNILRHSGSNLWGDPFHLDDMDLLGEEGWSNHYSLQTPAFFPSPLVADVLSGDAKELLIAGGDGLYCIGADGRVCWKYEVPEGAIFNTPTLVDLEGGPDPKKEDLEIIFATDHENGTTELVILKGDGSIVLEQNITHEGRGLLEVSASVIAEDLDGAFWDKGARRVPGDAEDKDMELLVFRFEQIEVYGLNDAEVGPSGGYLRTATRDHFGHSMPTPVVAGTDLDRELEIMFGSNQWVYNDWASWQGIMGATDNDLDPVIMRSQGNVGCAIIGSPAVGDMQGTVHENWTGNDLELVFGSVNGLLKVTNTGLNTTYMIFDTGGQITASPALCDIDHDRELEIIVASENGKVFCLDGNPSDDINEGVNYPGDGHNQDVLWVYDAGTTFGISSPVVADIDLDGVLEIVIGTTGGRVLCLSAGGRSLVGQADWPTFHGNNARTGYYYNYPTKWVEFGPKIDQNGMPYPIVKSVNPGSFIIFNLSVLLEGQGITEENREKINVHINLSTIPPGWSAWMDTPPDRGNDKPDYVRLASQETAHVALWVYAPWEGDFGEMARIDVVAYPETNPWEVKTVSCISVLNLFNDLEVTFLQPRDEDPLSVLFGKKWNTIDPGDDQSYNISVRNKGNVNDSYELTLSEPPVEAGWNWYFVETGTLNASASLTAPILADMFGGYSGQTFTVAVEASPDAVADTRIPIVIKGTSSNMGGDLQRTDELILVVGSVPGLSLVAFEDRYEISDEPLTIPLGLLNTGNVHPMNVLLSVKGKLSEWDVEYTEEPIPVYRGQTKTVPIMIRAPWAHMIYEAGTEFTLTFVGVVEGYSLNSNVNVTLVTPMASGLKADLRLPDDLDLEPGGSLNATLKLSSLSNFDEVIEITPFSIDSSLETDLTYGQGTPVDILCLDMLGEVELVVHVKAGKDADEGSYSINFLVAPTINLPIEVSFTVNVTRGGGIAANFLNEGAHRTDRAPIRDVRNYTLEITNEQNCPSLIHVSYG
ncbi:MAG: hypothetical protein JW939_03350, partial [Candidatus Thermoplasmatota archaeon]|nr:hypothetical protein [Candidatus Thermoplasmatota archaeon]